MCTHKAATERLIAGDYAGALAVAGPMLNANSGDLTAWYLTARALFGLGERDSSIKNLKSAALALAEERRPIFALSIIKELEDLGEGIDDLVERLAEYYCASSPRIEEAELAPPPLPSIVPTEKWSEDLVLEQRIERAREAMAVAWGDALAFVDHDSKLPFVPLFSSLPRNEFALFIESFWRQTFAPGEVIVEQDTPGDALYIVAEGEVTVTRIDAGEKEHELAQLGPGAFFGEMSIVSRAPRAARVVARTTSVLLRVSKDEMERLASRAPEIGNVLVAFCHARMLENLMRVSPVLAPVPMERRPDVIARFSTDYFESGQVIVKEGDAATGLFVIVSGRVSILKNDNGEQILLATLGPGDLLGEISLLMRRPSTATVVATEDTAVLALPSAEFQTVTAEFPELLKGAFDIALAREEQNNSILASQAAAADDLILV